MSEPSSKVYQYAACRRCGHARMMHCGVIVPGECLVQSEGNCSCRGFESLTSEAAAERRRADDPPGELVGLDKRCADALADEVETLIRRKVIDSRSPAADALLDYRNPPMSPRSDRLAQLDAKHDKYATIALEGEAMGCYPCDTCNGFRAHGAPCAVCMNRAATAQRIQDPVQTFVDWGTGDGDLPIAVIQGVRFIRDEDAQAEIDDLRRETKKKIAVLKKKFSREKSRMWKKFLRAVVGAVELSRILRHAR